MQKANEVKCVIRDAVQHAEQMLATQYGYELEALGDAMGHYAHGLRSHSTSSSSSSLL